MIKKIVTNPKELRKVSEVSSFAEAQDIIRDLEDTLDTDKGLGLAAIQIGIPKKVSVIRYKDKKIDLINPKLLEKYDKFRMQNEGCLSMPGIRVDTIRYKDIVIENEGHTYSFDIETDGIITIAIQHELMHMSGRLITDCKWRKR